MPIDPRILRAAAARKQQLAMRAALAAQSRGGQGSRGRGVQVGPVGVARVQQRVAGQQGRAQQQAANEQYERAKAEAGVGQAVKQGGGGGVKGFLGKVVGTAFKPLSVLQYGKNAIQTGVLELEEALLNESDKTPHWMRFMTAKPEQLKWFTPPDEVRAGRSNLDLITGRPGSYKGEVKEPLGFGSMVQDLPAGPAIGPSWLRVRPGQLADRVIGFAGDVGMDPLTHVAGGVDKIPGATGRARLALEATEKGLSPEVIDAARLSGARGVRKLGDEAAIKALELPEPGLRWGGREGLRIPGTGKLDEALTAVRQGVTEPLRGREFGKTIRKLGVSRAPATREMFESLLAREGGKYTPQRAAAFLLAKEASKGEAGKATAIFENLARDIDRKGGSNAAITHAYEAGDLSSKVAKDLDTLAKGVLKVQEEAGASVGRHADKPWVPHVLTREGMEVFGHETSDVPGFVRGATQPKAQAQQFSREIVPGGKYKIKGHWYRPKTATIKEANDWAAAHGLPKLYEDAPGKLAAHMTVDASNAVEEATMWQRLATEGPHRQAFGVEDRRATTVDKAATRAASKEAGEEVAGQLEQLLRSTANVDEAAAATRARIEEAQAGLAAIGERGAAPGVSAAPTPAAPVAAAAPEIEEQLAPIAARAAQPVNVPAEVGPATAARSGALAQGAAPLRETLLVNTVEDLELQAQRGMNRAQLEATIGQLPAHAQALVRQTIENDADGPLMGKFLDDMRQGKLNNVIVREANEGMVKMATDPIIGRDVFVHQEVQRMLANFNEVMAASHKDPTWLGKLIDEQVRFFKSWALATPGQHVRNAMSATFMNATEGVTAREMWDGFSIFRAFRKANIEDRISGAWVEQLPTRLQAVAPDVVKAVYATGAGGRYTAAELGTRAFGEDINGSMLKRLFRRSYDNRLTEASHNIGERWVEGPARSALALHTLGEDMSGSFADAVGRIKRVHFDYSDVNELDQKLRRYIPFWTFMSRNLPLQVQQMWTNPRVYSQYQSLMNNVADPNAQGQPMPTWLGDMGARYVNNTGLAFAPDVGASQVTDTLQSLRHPGRLVADTNPLLKTLAELTTNRNFFYDAPYRANDWVKPGIEARPFMPMLRAAGVVKDTAQGPVVERKYLEQIKSNIPLTGTINRLGSTSSDREGKGANAWFGFLGAPVRQVDLAKELENRQFAEQRKGREQQNLRRALAKYGGEA